MDGSSGLVSLVGSAKDLKEVYHLEAVARDQQDTLITTPLTISLGHAVLDTNRTLQFTIKENIQGWILGHMVIGQGQLMLH